ncbi:MAG: hypothetical protein FJW88_04945 [Actinobacteria bacterium]|nr:hypothetical protein [Actinomycetota bacterium]
MGAGCEAVGEEARALRALAEAGDALVAGIERSVPTWVTAQVERILDAWGRASPAVCLDAERAAAAAGVSAAHRVASELRALLTRDPAEQARTPAEIVRSVVREPTAVLTAVGVPPVERDPFDERAVPEDRYDLAPRSLADLGGPELGAALLAWGMAKAAVLRARLGG